STPDGRLSPTAGRGPGEDPARTAGVYSPHPSYTRGVVSGINKGYFRRQIAEASYRFSEECEAGDRVIVGVNGYTEGNDDRPIEILQISHEVEVQQVERLRAFKQKRDAKAAAAALDRIRRAAQGGDPEAEKQGLHKTNVMPALVNGAQANCT